MKKIALLALFLVANQACSSNSTVFELNPAQSMVLTGKGPGQDGAINPYSNQRSTAVVKNIGENTFNVRIQKEGKIIEDQEVASKSTKKFILEKGYELYLDSNLQAKAKVTFQKLDL
jgi:hypothetical protein